MISLVFHTHLPYVLHHGTWPHGSDWLCEAVAECYLPLLKVCDRLLADGIRPGLTFDISPVLCEQLAHPDFPEVFISYCDNHMALAKSDNVDFTAQGQTERVTLAEFWCGWYEDRRNEFVHDYHTDVIGAFNKLQEDGAIEIMTCGATHGYLPLLAEDDSVERQLVVAKENYIRHFGKAPKGIWLPECAYRPGYQWRTLLPVSHYSIAHRRYGIEELLEKHELQYFITDEGALKGAMPIGYRTDDGPIVPVADTVGEVRTQLEEKNTMDVFELKSNSSAQPVKILTRSMNIAMQVWSGQSGYPGDPDYLDFHKKYHKSALRYWRVTDNNADMEHKAHYNPEWAEDRARAHAAHYVSVLETTYRHHSSLTERQRVICLPFDTELFGHWWFEGPQFLENLIRGLDQSATLHTATVAEVTESIDTRCVISLPESSWGENGNHDVWMNPQTEWTWEKEYELEFRVRKVLESTKGVALKSGGRRLLKNLFRELLLCQSSDWQFLISTFSAKEYAEMRFHNHHADAFRLCELLEKFVVDEKVGADDLTFLDECELRDDIFDEELESLVSQHEGVGSV